MGSRERWLLEEAQKWQAEGRIPDSFRVHLERRYSDVDEEGYSKTRLYIFIIGGAVLAMGIIALVSQFWEDLDKTQQFALLAFSALVFYAVGFLLEFYRRFASTTVVSLGVGTLLFFAAFMVIQSETLGFTGAEIGSSVAAFVIALAVLGSGYFRYPILAALGTACVYWALLLITIYRGGSALDREVISVMLVVGVILATANLFVWAFRTWTYQRPAWADRFLVAGVRNAAIVNAVLLVPVLINFVEQVLRPTDSWAHIIAVAVYALATGTAGVILRFPGMVLVGGVVAVGDAVYAGFDKGELLGLVFTLIGLGIALIVLAQSGVLRKWLSPGSVPEPPKAVAVVQRRD